MRVTKAIREYVEEQIAQKFNAKIKGLGVEYKAKQDAVKKHVDEIMQDAAKAALEYIASEGFEWNGRSYGYCDRDAIFERRGDIVIKDEETAIERQRCQLRNKQYDKIKQVLFDLEIGETGKAELQSVLDSITVD